MSRRALSPAARGVLLAVSAVLRGRVAAIDDQSDGTTHARVVEPDGTVLLDVRVRSTGRRDSRQTPLPLAPGPRHETPAPVAVQRTEAPAPQPDPVRVRVLHREWDAAAARNDFTEAALCEPVDGIMLDWSDAAPWETALVPTGRVLEALRTVCKEAGIALHEGDEAPAPPVAPRVEIRGLAAGDRITLDDDHFTVTHVDTSGFTRQDIGDDGPEDEGKVYWSEVEEVGPRAYRIKPIDTRSPAQREADERKATKAPRVAKTKPARLTPEPEADALTEHGKVCLVGQEREGAAWELFAADTRLPPASWDTGRKSYARIRGYNRAGKCVRDSRDEGGAS